MDLLTIVDPIVLYCYRSMVGIPIQMHINIKQTEITQKSIYPSTCLSTHPFSQSDSPAATATEKSSHFKNSYTMALFKLQISGISSRGKNTRKKKKMYIFPCLFYFTSFTKDLQKKNKNKNKKKQNKKTKQKYKNVSV